MTVLTTRAKVAPTGNPSTAPGRPAARRAWAWARVLGGVAVLAVLLWRVGTGPFLDGVRMIHPWVLAAAVAIGALTTTSSACRWTLIARCLGVDLPLRPALAAYYRSQFLNTTLPGGVIGDVHRALRHGRDIGDLPLAVRAVVVDRLAGLIVTLILAAALLTALPSPVRPHLPTAALNPTPQAPVWPMDAFRDKFLAAYGS
jgi:glycosyltransferase 2 family protein